MGSLTSAIFGKVCYDLSRSPANHLAWLSWDWLCSGQPQCSSRYAAGWSWEKRGALRWMHGHKTEAQGRAVNTCFCEVCGGQQHHMLLATREYRAIEWEHAALGNFLLLFVSASIHARVMYIPSTVHSAAPWGIQVVSASAPWLDSVCRNCAFSLWQQFLGEHSQRCSFQVGH